MSSWNYLIQTRNFSLLWMLTEGLEWCGLLWCFISCLDLSFWRHPFTAEDPWWASDITRSFSKSVLIQDTNSSTIGWPEGTDILSKFSFLGKYFFNRATEFKPFRWVNKQSLRFHILTNSCCRSAWAMAKRRWQSGTIILDSCNTSTC